jgi:hypothetical protein
LCSAIIPVDGQADGLRVVHGSDAGGEVIGEQDDTGRVVTSGGQVDGYDDTGGLAAGGSGDSGTGRGKGLAHFVLLKENAFRLHWDACARR